MEIDLRETSRALADDQKQHDGQKAKIDTLNAAIAAAEQALELARESVLAATQGATAAQTEQRNVNRVSEEVTGRLRRMETELASLEHARNEAQARWTKAQAGLAEADTAATGQRARIQQLDTSLTETRTDRDVKRESLAQARLELAERRQKVEVLDRGLGEMEKRRQQLGELLAQRQIEIESWSDQTEGLEQESVTQRERAARLAETLQVAQAQVEEIRTELVGIEREISRLEADQTSRMRDQAETAHDQLSSHEIRLAEHRQRAQFLAEDAAREFAVEVGTIDWKHLLWHAEDEPEGLKTLDLEEEDEPENAGSPAEALAKADGSASGHAAPAKRRKKDKVRGELTEADRLALDATNWDEIKAEVEALRQRLGGMGAVNLVAIEEYAELKQRHDFLKTQSNDLTAAKTGAGFIWRLSTRSTRPRAASSLLVTFRRQDPERISPTPSRRLFGGGRGGARTDPVDARTSSKVANRNRRAAAGNEAEGYHPAFRRPEDAHRGGAPLCALHGEALALLPPRRTRRAPR